MSLYVSVGSADGTKTQIHHSNSAPLQFNTEEEQKQASLQVTYMPMLNVQYDMKSVIYLNLYLIKHSGVLSPNKVHAFGYLKQVAKQLCVVNDPLPCSYVIDFEKIKRHHPPNSTSTLSQHVKKYLNRRITILPLYKYHLRRRLDDGKGMETE